MHPSVYDPCLLYFKKSMAINSRLKSTPRGIVCLQTDDTAYVANKVFQTIEERERHRFDSKDAEILSTNTTLKFNGGQLHFDHSTYTINQPIHVDNTSTLGPKSFTVGEFISERARVSYIAAVCRPASTYAFCVASQVTNPKEKDIKNLNKAIESCKQSPDFWLKFVPPDIESVVCAVFADAGFATNADMPSQLGFVMFVIDKYKRVNVAHYGSLKSKRITRSVLAAELFATVHGFDVSFTIRLAVTDILRRTVPLHVYTDSRSLFHCLTNISQTSEKRLLTDLYMLRQSHERREITEVFWIPTKQNPADTCTKSNPCDSLQKMLQSNHIDLTPNAWVGRKDPVWAKKEFFEQKTPECYDRRD